MVWVKKHITKEMCLGAMSQTKSVKSAARYLNCSYQHLKPFMKSYIDEATGKSLFDLHKNQSGKGIPKFLSGYANTRKEPHITKVLSGEVDASHFSTEKLKYRLFESGIVEEKCMACGFQEKRVVDNKIPVILHFRDGDKRHFTISNILVTCYNCFFLQYGRVFSETDLRSIEDNRPIDSTTDRVHFELDEYHRKKLDELGIFEDKVTDDPYDLVSRKK